MADDERPDEDAAPGLRAARGWAVAALLLLVTSLWLPWWLVRFRTPAGLLLDEAATRPFLADPMFAASWAPWASGVPVALACLVLFVRVAGRSWLYEPASWQRDLIGAAVLAGGAAASALVWPRRSEEVIGGFWSDTRFSLNDTAGDFVVETLPGLGWWCAVAATLLLGRAWWLGRAP